MTLFYGLMILLWLMIVAVSELKQNKRIGPIELTTGPYCNIITLGINFSGVFLCLMVLVHHILLAGYGSTLARYVC